MCHGPGQLLCWQIVGVGSNLYVKRNGKKAQRSGKVSEGRASNTKKRKLIDLTACDILSSEELSLKSCSSVYQSRCIQTGITIENHHRQERGSDRDLCTIETYHCNASEGMHAECSLDRVMRTSNAAQHCVHLEGVPSGIFQRSLS